MLSRSLIIKDVLGLLIIAGVFSAGRFIRRTHFGFVFFAIGFFAIGFFSQPRAPGGGETAAFRFPEWGAAIVDLSGFSVKVKLEEEGRRLFWRDQTVRDLIRAVIPEPVATRIPVDKTARSLTSTITKQV